MKYLLDFDKLSTRQLAGFILICIAFVTYLYFMIFMYRTAKPELKEELVKLAGNSKARRRKNVIMSTNSMASLQYLQTIAGEKEETPPASPVPSRIRKRTKSVVDVMLSKEMALDNSDETNMWLMNSDDAEPNSNSGDVEMASHRVANKHAIVLSSIDWNEDVDKDPEDLVHAEDEDDEEDADEEEKELADSLNKRNEGDVESGNGTRASSPIDDRLKRLSGRRHSLSIGTVNEIDDLLKGKDGLLNTDKRDTSLLVKLFGMFPDDELKVVEPVSTPTSALSSSSSSAPNTNTTAVIENFGFMGGPDDEYVEEWERQPATGIVKQVSFEKTSASKNRRVSFLIASDGLNLADKIKTGSSVVNSGVSSNSTADAISQSDIEINIALSPDADNVSSTSSMSRPLLPRPPAPETSKPKQFRSTSPGADTENLDGASNSNGGGNGRQKPRSHSISATTTDLLNNPLMAANITCIQLVGQTFDTDALALLVKSLNQPDMRIRELMLRECQLRDFEAALIARSLIGNETLRKLDLSNNLIKKDGCAILANLFGYVDLKNLGKISQKSSTKSGTAPDSSRTLDSHRQYRSIPDTDGIATQGSNYFEYSNEFSHKTSVHGDNVLLTTGDCTPKKQGSKRVVLDLPSDRGTTTDRTVNDEDTSIFINVNFNTTIQELNMSGNRIGPQGAAYLAKALLDNSTMLTVDVSYQKKGFKIGPEGAHKFADWLNRDSCKLLTFRCARNNIGFEGCRHLSSALFRNTHLRELDIGGVNYITIAGALQLGQAIKCNKSSHLAWLTVGEHRIPINPLIGRNSYRSSVDHELATDRLLGSASFTSTVSYVMGKDNKVNLDDDEAVIGGGTVVHHTGKHIIETSLHSTNHDFVRIGNGISSSPEPASSEQGGSRCSSPSNIKTVGPSSVVAIDTTNISTGGDDEIPLESPSVAHEREDDVHHADSGAAGSEVNKKLRFFDTDDSDNNNGSRSSPAPANKDTNFTPSANNNRSASVVSVASVASIDTVAATHRHDMHTVRIHRIQTEAVQLYRDKKFVSTTQHGMEDELGVVVATLVTHNRTLEWLQIDDAKLPIQQLIGNDPVDYLDLSEKNLSSIDTIIIGSLIAENSNLKMINLRDNNFGSTEGENFVAYALERNYQLKLDLAKWSAAQMYHDGYPTLAAVLGLSTSGVTIEPQRLEGCFYQSLTVISAIMFYVGVFSDIVTLYQFANNPDVYYYGWVILLAVIMCVPTVMYLFNTVRNLICVDLAQALWGSFLVVFQILPALLAYRAVRASMENVPQLDLKFVQATHKAIPQIYFQSFIMFAAGITKGVVNYWSLISNLSSLLSITVIFIMLFDRKAARRMSMAPLSDQPSCAVGVARIFEFFGMGTTTKEVKAFVNFDAFYTAHYCLSYVYQLVGLTPRIVSIAWLLACGNSVYGIIAICSSFVVRIVVMLLHDAETYHRSLFNNIVTAISLVISDSAWHFDPAHPDSSLDSFLTVSYLSSMEVLMILFYCFLIFEGSKIPDRIQATIFATMIFGIGLRWLTLFGWAIRIHFPQFFLKNRSNRRGSVFVTTDKTGETKFVFGWNPLKHAPRPGSGRF